MKIKSRIEALSKEFSKGNAISEQKKTVEKTALCIINSLQGKFGNA